MHQTFQQTPSRSFVGACHASAATHRSRGWVVSVERGELEVYAFGCSAQIAHNFVDFGTGPCVC